MAHILQLHSISIRNQGNQRMKFTRRFTDPNKDPYEAFKYEIRSSMIRHFDGKSATEEILVEVPVGWSQTAVDILAQKYLRMRDVPLLDNAGIPLHDSEGRPKMGGETSVKQVVDRLAGCWRHWGEILGYFNSPEAAESFYAESAYMLLNQMAAPNSPQWFNTGLAWKYGIKGEAQGHWYVDPDDEELKPSLDAYSRPQPHACFIQSVEDDMLGEHGIYSLLAKEARIFKYGSGTGTNFSAIRGEGEPLKGGGKSSGLMSFLKVFDRAAGAIKSGGTTRRAAKMVCLDLDHPEIEAFIRWKSREEAKVAAMVAGSRLLNRSQGLTQSNGQSISGLIPEGWMGRIEALADQGITPEPVPELDTGFEGEGYATVSGQNSNNSVRVPDAFLEAVQADKDWDLKARTNGSVVKTLKAAKLWDLVALSTWESADPGVQFVDTINEWHTCPKDGPIRASNPCSEYMFLDDTACNLASLNLVRFQDPDGSLRIEDFQHAVKIWTIVLDISVGMAQFPSPEIARKTHEFRTLGLGYANLGAFLMRAGIPYDSPQATAWTGGITALMGGVAYKTSAELAKSMGPFPRFAPNRTDMLRVIRNHVRAARGEKEGYEGLSITPWALDTESCPKTLATAARIAWEDALTQGETTGFRNAQVTVLAPTGTIGLLMDCDTTGIEPDFSLVKFKKLSGGGLIKIVNRSLAVALRKLGYSAKDIAAIDAYCLGTGTLEGAPHINAPALALRGFPEEKIEAVEKALPRSLNLSDAFSSHVLGQEFLRSLGIPEEIFSQGGREILEDLGFTTSQIDAADLAICGAQTVEGAPGLDPADYPVFDCANPCGRGKRSVAPKGHLGIMAAAQPFLSGAISKTVNLPTEATVAEVQDVYFSAWKWMIKAVAIYRDGSKLSQPLNSKAQKKPAQTTTASARKETVSDPIAAPVSVTKVSPKVSEADTVQRPIRLRLPTRRGGFVQEATISGHKVFLRTGEYPDGSLGEIFIDMYKEGAAYRGILNCFAVLTSKALQYGVPLEELVDTFTFTRFEPAGPVEGHDNIKTCTSILDLIFRVLGLSYLGNTDFVHIKPLDVRTSGPGAPPTPNSSEDSVVRATTSELRPALQSNVFIQKDQARRAGYTGESCGSCGSIRVRRNGTCVVCEDCGTTSGCS